MKLSGFSLAIKAASLMAFLSFSSMSFAGEVCVFNKGFMNAHVTLPGSDMSQYVMPGRQACFKSKPEINGLLGSTSPNQQVVISHLPEPVSVPRDSNQCIYLEANNTIMVESEVPCRPVAQQMNFNP